MSYWMKIRFDQSAAVWQRPNTAAIMGGPPFHRGAMAIGPFAETMIRNAGIKDESELQTRLPKVEDYFPSHA